MKYEVVLEEEDTGRWIERNLPDSLSIRSLQLFQYDGESIGDSIAQLVQLTHLSIRLCKKLKCVSNVMKLHNLQVLKIKYRNMLEELPANLGDLRNLTHLHLSYCQAIKCLPNSIVHLSKLSTLKVKGCDSLKKLPAKLGDLRNLTQLHLSYCRAIKCLPNSIAQLSKLSTLEVKNCNSLKKLPVKLGDLRNLTQLHLSYCRAIKCLPNSIVHLSKLSTLEVENCDSLEKLPTKLGDLRNLTHIKLNFCRTIKFIPNSIASLSKLSTLELYICESLELPANLGELTNLTHLKVSYRKGIKSPSNSITQISKLSSLVVANCQLLEKLPAKLGELSNLTELRLFECRAIKRLPNSIVHLSKLSTLKVEHCHSLEELPAKLGELTNLTHFKLGYSMAIKSLPNSIVHLSKLSTFKVEWCDSLEELPAKLGELTNLTHFKLKTCRAIKSLPNSIAKLSNLSTLKVKDCRSLEAMPANVIVVKLTLKGCRSLSEQCLSNFTGLGNLQRLRLGLDVEKLPINLDEMPKLVLLDVSQCDKIKYLPCSINSFCKLQTLYLPRHFILETLPSYLNDSVIISVKCSHIRKTWKELKLDMGPRFIETSPPLVDMVMETAQNCSSISGWGYLSLKENPSTWMRNHYNLCSQIRLLDLQLPYNTEEIAGVLWALPNLTHLYISANFYRQKLCLPYTTTILTHLSLDGCDLEYLSSNLDKLSKLKSLDLSLVTHERMGPFYVRYFQTIPESMESLVSLEHLTLRRLDSSLPNSLAKLCNLNTLELHSCYKVSSFPENMNLSQLKLVSCSVESFPLRLCHLEIVHDLDICHSDHHGCDLKMLLKLPINLKTLSLTCYTVEYLPSITALHLQIILFKECFDLRKLMPNMDELVELCTLDISDTMITSLPGCITRLPNLQHLVLPKCFKPKNLPREFLRNKSKLKIEYEDNETSDEDNEITPGSVVGVDDGIQREVVKEGIINEQSSSCRLPIPPEALEGVQAMVVGDDSIGEQQQIGLKNTHNNSNSCGAHEKSNKRKIKIIREEIQSLRDDNMSLAEGAMKLGVSRSTMKRRCKELKLGEWPSSRKKKISCPKKREIITRSPSGGELSQPNLMESTYPAEPEYANEGLDQVAPQSDPIVNSIPSATRERDGEFMVSNPIHIDVHESVSEHMVGTHVYSLFGSKTLRMSTGNFPWCKDVPDFIIPYIIGWTDVIGDGNCGFRVIAKSCYGDQDCWPHVRRAMSLEMQANIDQYATLYGGSQGPIEAISRISGHMNGQALRRYWIDTPLDLYSASTVFCVAFVMLATLQGVCRDMTEACTTVLPLRSWVGAREPKGIIVIAHVNTNHYVLVYLRDNFPLPPVWYRWEKARHESVVGWKDPYMSRMVEWTNLRGNVDQHNLSDQLASQCDPIDVSTPNATTKTIKELNEATQSHLNVRESALEHMVGSDLHSLLGIVQDCSNSSTFDIKATYKGDTVKFKWSSTTCLNELKEAVVENLNVKINSFKLKYYDEEEWLLINTNEHLKSAFRYIKNNILRLQVTDM